MMYDLVFYHDDDKNPLPETALARSRTSRKVPGIGEGVTFVTRDGAGAPSRYRVVDVDHAYTAQHQATNFTESTVAVYLIDHDDPRRLGR